jgi:hypothetical protein
MCNVSFKIGVEAVIDQISKDSLELCAVLDTVRSLPLC